MINVDWSAIGSIGTAVAVFVAALQVRKSTQQARTDFEDDLSREYREVARSIPLKAHLGRELMEEEVEQALLGLYQYIDLTNEQIFLRMNGRISKATWLNWVDGIKSNLGRPAFTKAWAQIKDGSSGSFEELRRLEVSGFADDPRRWIPAWKRVWRK
jgi:hypothetical protein